MPDVEVFLAIGADLRADPATWSFTDVTTSVRESQKVTIERGKRARLGLVQTTRVSATADNTDGALSRHNPLGTHFGLLRKHCPMRVDVEGVTRATVFLTGTPPKWDPSERDQTVTLQAVGILDRLLNARLLGSALRRTLAGTSPGGYRPLVYYPCEVGSAATAFTSAVTGGAPVAIPPDVTPAADSTLVGSAALPTWPVSTGADFPVPGYTDTGQWVARWILNVPAVAPGGSGHLAHFYTSGTVVRWSVTLDPGSPDVLTLRGYNIGGTQVASATTGIDSGDLGGEDDWYGHTHMMAVSAQQVGANITAKITSTRDDGLQIDVGSVTVAGTAGVLVNNAVIATVIDNQVQGHLSIVTDATFDIGAYFADAAADNSSQAMDGFDGEAPDARAERLCEEEGVRLTVTGTTTAAMGPQTPGTLLSNLRDAELAGHATLAESMDWGLSLLFPSAQYNVTSPAIQLDYAASEIAPPWNPVDDDHQYANSVVATRPSGASYRAVDSDEEDEVGEVETTTRPPVATDNAVADHAGWSLHLAVNDELTWPAVRPNVLAAPALLTAWLTTDVGSQMWAVNHPSPLAPDTIRQIIEGSTETYGSVSAEISAILTPASPYDVAVVEDTTLGRADTDGMVITAAIDGDDLSCLLATTTPTSALATTAAGSFPVNLRLTPDLRMMGEVITVNDIDAPTTITFVAAGTVAHANSASVTPGLPAGRAAGDLLLTLVAIRNSGTGVPVVPAGQTLLLDMGNVMLLGRIADGTASDQPTITFTGGVANADTSAQQACWRGAFSAPDECLVVYNALLNSSGQNISYPALNVQQANNLIIYVGWKQDDWTSVAGPGTEIGEPDTVTGDDQGIVWAYTIQTTATDIAAGSFTVTGGISAISRGAVCAIRSNVQLATISARSVNDVSRSWPARTGVALAASAVPGY